MKIWFFLSFFRCFLFLQAYSQLRGRVPEEAGRFALLSFPLLPGYDRFFHKESIMAFGFREYLKAELLTELLSSLFLGGKHPRITAFFLLLFLGSFLVFGMVFKGVFGLLGWIFSGGKSGKMRKSLADLKKAAKPYRDKVSPVRVLRDVTGEKWWNSEVLLAGSGNSFSFLIHPETGELRVFFVRPGFATEPIGLSTYLLEAQRRSQDRILQESDALGSVYQQLRTVYRPEIVFAWFSFMEDGSMKSGMIIALLFAAQCVLAGEAKTEANRISFSETISPKPEIVRRHHPLLRTAVRGAIDGGFAATSAKFAASGGVLVLLASIVQKAETICLLHTGSHSCATLKIGE